MIYKYQVNMKMGSTLLFLLILFNNSAFAQKSISGCSIGAYKPERIDKALIAGVYFIVNVSTNSENRINKITAVGDYGINTDKRNEIIDALGERFDIGAEKMFLGRINDHPVTYYYNAGKKLKSNSFQNESLAAFKDKIPIKDSDYQYEEVKKKATISMKIGLIEGELKYIITIQDTSSSDYNNF